MRAGSKTRADPLPAAAVIGADPGTILAAVTPVPDTMSEYQFAGPAARQAGRADDMRLGAAQGAGRRRDRARGPGQPRGLRRRGAVRRSHRLLQRGRAVPGVHGHRDDDAARADLSLDLHRPAAGRALGARRGAERGLSAAVPPAVPGGRGLLAAARGLLLPGRGGDDQEGVSRPRQARDAGRVVLSCASSCTPSS